MIYRRRYLQFNDFVFDGYDMISEDSNTSVSFKANTTERSFGHGSYTVFKRPYMFAKEASVSMTLRLAMKKLPCEYRDFYRDFAVSELTKAGKLWAVQNNQIVWAYAYLSNYGEQRDVSINTTEIDVEFTLYEGIWHKADRHRTFLLPYDVCTLFDCKGFKKPTSCNDDCCNACVDSKHTQKKLCCCCCEDITKDMALCAFDDVQDLYAECTSGYQIYYDCRKGAELFGEKSYGERICTKDICNDNMIAGRFYSNTDIPTTAVDIIISGTMHNPFVTINGNTNVIEGDYEGDLVIKSNGDVFLSTGCCETLQDPSVWSIPDGQEYGWTINQGENSIVVNLNSCCVGKTCVYINADAITI